MILAELVNIYICTCIYVFTVFFLELFKACLPHNKILYLKKKLHLISYFLLKLPLSWINQIWCCLDLFYRFYPSTFLDYSPEKSHFLEYILEYLFLFWLLFILWDHSVKKHPKKECVRGKFSKHLHVWKCSHPWWIV